MKSMNWDWEIKPQAPWAGVSLKELGSFKDLLFSMVRKEFLSQYQQTLLGPVWILLYPLLTVATYVLVFNKVIGVSTEGIPSFLYYLTGITLWNLFAEIFQQTAYTFVNNSTVFSKVYFPRLIAPISILVLNFLRFGIQLFFLASMLAYYYLSGEIRFNLPNIFIAIPVIIVTAGIAFGTGLVFSVITGKYKDLFGLLQLIIRLLMFICPIFYSLSLVPVKIKWLVNINPLSSLFQLFRYSLLNTSSVELSSIIYSITFMLIMLVVGIVLFNRMGDKLMDVL